MFKRPSLRYGKAVEPETPYQRAAQAWDDRIGSARIQARNWRLIAFGCLAVSAGLAGGLVWQGARGTITPWIVEVDQDAAQAVTGRATLAVPQFDQAALPGKHLGGQFPAVLARHCTFDTFDDGRNR